MVVGALLLHLPTLLRYPLPFVDEAWYTCRAWAWLETGRNFGTLDAGVFDRFDGYWTYFCSLPQTYLHALGLSLGGDTPSLFAVRAVSLLGGLALLLAVGSIARTLAGRREAALAMLLLAGSPVFAYGAHMARPDGLAAACGFWAAALALRHARGGLTWHVLAGLCVGAAFELHPHAAFFGPAVLGLYVLEHGRGTLRDRRPWGYVCGVLGGLAFHVGMHIAPYPETYRRISELAFSATHAPPLLSFDPAVLVRAFVDTAVLLLECYSLGTLLLVGCVAYALRAADPASRRLLVFLGLLLGGLSLWIRNKLVYYGILVAPACDLLLAVMGLRALRALRERLSPTLRRALVVALCLFPLVRTLPLVLSSDGAGSFARARDGLRERIRADETIIGPQTYWFAFPARRYLSWETLVYYRRAEPTASLEDAFRALRPDVLIVDRHLRQFIVDEGDDAAPAALVLYRQHLSLDRAELAAFLTAHAEEAGSVAVAGYGEISVYRFRWTR